MHIHILGICGTFMGGIAVLAKQAGHVVTGCDTNVYPPMSTQLEAQGIRLTEGFGLEQLALRPDIFVVGNVVTRGKQPLMEAILDRGLPYISGPQWLFENVLRDKWVLAVAGTHGKTTTASMLAWIMEDCGLDPGYLIGGVPMNFGVSARLTESSFFVIEADEYDTAFFDKRSKFVHYHPRTAILNNLEYDHADIFPDLAAIETQFHHLVRTVPGNGLVVVNGGDHNLLRTLGRGCWSPVEYFGGPALGACRTLVVDSENRPQRGHFLPDSPPHGCSMVQEAGEKGSAAVDLQPTIPRSDRLLGWKARAENATAFTVSLNDNPVGRVEWSLQGEHNRLNALAAIAAARHVGVPAIQGIEALSRFVNVKRRMEWRGEAAGVTVYDDFAHHPTAIATTLAGLRATLDDQARILAVLEPRSNTMKLGVMKDQLPASLKQADRVFCYSGGIDWDVAAAMAPLGDKATTEADLPTLVERIVAAARAGDRILVMSNGGFGGIHDLLLRRLAG